MSLSLYSRRNCSLCEVFEQELSDFLQQQKISANYEIKDVDSNSVWQQLYGNDVPVLARDEQVICQHFFDSEKVLNALG